MDTIRDEDIQKARVLIAFAYGQVAHQKGKKRIPVLDQNIMGMLKNGPFGETDTLVLLESWIKGWDSENLSGLR